MKLVVKVGSNVLTRPDGKPNVTNMSALVDQIAKLHADGHKVVLVSSGAVACGRGAIAPSHPLDSVAQRQIYSSIGQIRLINLYDQLFGAYDIVVGQVLTQKDNFSSPTASDNQRNCLLNLIDNGVVPIVNENDTASLTELMFTDNDEMSGLIATMIGADMLILLTNVDGIFTGDPRDPDSRLIRHVAAGEDLSRFIADCKSGLGRGGMESKCLTASRISSRGVAVAIARGDRPGVLVDIMERPDSIPFTLFDADERND